METLLGVGCCTIIVLMVVAFIFVPEQLDVLFAQVISVFVIGPLVFLMVCKAIVYREDHEEIVYKP